MKIGIVGNGFVGRATAEVWKPFYEVRIHDALPERSVHSLEEVLECDIVFVCLPTPAKEDGTCDTSALINFFGNWRVGGNDRLFVIKSTVPVGFTQQLVTQWKLRVVHNPEFLTARTAVIDALTPTAILIGHEGNCPEGLDKLWRIYEQRFPGITIMGLPSKCTEMAKLVRNSFFAVKISFFNEMYRWAEAEEVDWEELMWGVLSDGRIAHSHTQVPGRDGTGFGGACLPKDLSNTICSMRAARVDPSICVAAESRNRSDRLTVSSTPDTRCATS